MTPKFLFKKEAGKGSWEASLSQGGLKQKFQTSDLQTEIKRKC